MSQASSLRRTALWSGIGVLLLLLGWHLLAVRLGPLLMATPQQAWQALGRLVSTAEFARHAGASVLRVSVGVSLGIGLGLLLAMLSARSERLRVLLEPLRWLVMSVPPVILVVLAMLWLGMGTAMVLLIAVLLLSPSVYINVLRGLQLLDPDLGEMATVYRFGRWRRLQHVVLPAIAIPLCTALHLACCSGVRLVVMAEVIGAIDGAGFALAHARSSLDSATVYAWVLLVVMLVAAMELLFLHPLQRYLTRWQRESAQPTLRVKPHA